MESWHFDGTKLGTGTQCREREREARKLRVLAEGSTSESKLD